MISLWLGPALCSVARTENTHTRVSVQLAQTTGTELPDGRQQTACSVDPFGEAGTLVSFVCFFSFYSKRPLMSQEQHKGDNHQGWKRKKGRRHFKRIKGKHFRCLLFFLKPGLVFFFVLSVLFLQSRKCLTKQEENRADSDGLNRRTGTR